MSWIKRISYNDGGRRAAGFKTVQMGDCVNRALAIVTGKDYMTTRRILNDFIGKERGPNRSCPDNGVFPKTYEKFLKSLGAGKMIKIKEWSELPETGRCFVVLEGHVVAYIDGVFHDTYDPVERGVQLEGYYAIG